MSILDLIKSGRSEVYRRAYIKRRSASDGSYESEWLEITSDVKSFGKIRQETDSVRVFKFSFGNVKLVVENDTGRYNPSDNDFSLWSGYLNQQRTLVKIEAGFVLRERRADGYWINAEFGGFSRWGECHWGSEDAYWGKSAAFELFQGVISGDVSFSDKNEVAFTVRPLTSVFEDYPAAELTGWTSTGLTASQFVTMLRDQTDGSGRFIFRPFFGNTTANWDISTTSITYPSLNTATADGVFDKTVWEVIEKLAEAENFIPYSTGDGKFKFVSREVTQLDPVFEFHGTGSFSSVYGQTIKEITSFGQKPSKYSSRVEVKFKDTSTAEGIEVTSAAYSVSPGSNPFVLGHKTIKIENFFIQNTATAKSIAAQVFAEYSSLKREVDFRTSFVPHLSVLDRVSLHYDPTPPGPNSIWDSYNWADDSTGTSQDLIWDYAAGEAMALDGTEFKFLSVEIDLDNFECRFLAREV